MMKGTGGPSSTDNPLVPEDDWPSQYGAVIAQYHGSGTLILRTGEDLSCRFQAVQLSSGYLLLLCTLDKWSLLDDDSVVERFEGATAQGDAVYAEHLTPIACPPSLPARVCSSAFLMRELRVEIDTRGKQASTARFGIANFEFVGTEGRRLGSRHTLVLPVRLHGLRHTDDVVITPVSDYAARIWRAKVLRGIEVTSEAIIRLEDANDLDGVTSLATDLCYLFSAARGTKVQWLYRDVCNADDVPIVRTYCLHVVKPFTPLPIVNPRPEGRAETRSFVEQTYPIYLSKREAWRLDGGVLDAYLDARAEHDYLQMRGLKLAVAVEMLKTIFLGLPECSVRGDILDLETFQSLRGKIKRAVGHVLNEAGIVGADRSAMYAKIPELNRRPFRDVLEELCAEIDLKVTEQDLKLFVACRNSLVHRGYFYNETATEEQRRKCKPLSSPVEEYFFLVNFLDKVILRLLGYSGPYINCRTSGKPVREEL